MKNVNSVRALLMALALAPSVLPAQVAGSAQVRSPQVGGRGREMAERQIGQLLREQLQLTDAQVARLQEVNRKFNPRRTALVQEERQVRLSMRDALCSEDRSNPAEVGRWIDQMLELEKRRIELRIEEQRELSGFLTPYQRARFLGTLEVVQRRFEGQGGPGGRGGPPGERRGGGRGGPPPQGRGGPPVDACGNPMPPPGDRRGRDG